MELITGRRPGIHYFRIFGCRTHVHIHDAERSKSNRFQPIAKPATFLGYVPGSKSFLVGMRGSIYTRRSVYFDEDVDAIIKRHAQNFNIEESAEPNRPRPIEEDAVASLDPTSGTAQPDPTPVEGGPDQRMAKPDNFKNASPTPAGPEIGETPPVVEQRHTPATKPSTGSPAVRRSTRRARRSTRAVSLQGYAPEGAALRRALKESKAMLKAALIHPTTGAQHQNNYNWRRAQREHARPR